MNIAYNRDCLEAMREMEDKAFDLAIVDPPFFKGVASKGFYGTGKSRRCIRPVYDSKVWDLNIPTKEYFQELLRVSKNQIIWGINYFEFSEFCGVGRIIWDKQNDTSTFSNCEIASCSLIHSVKIFRYLWDGFRQGEKSQTIEKRIHPTQKPVALYKWLLQNYAKQGNKILDTHLGSGSSRIACHDLGFDFVGYEKDKDYFEAQEKRFAEHCKQPQLFTPEPQKVEQVGLF